MVASYFWYPTKLLGPVLPFFLFVVKRIRENKTRGGLLDMSTWQLQKRKEKLIFSVSYKVILINPRFRMVCTRKKFQTS